MRLVHETQLRDDSEHYEHAEHRRQEELAVKEDEIICQDAGVIEKTKFLAQLADQIDPSHTIAGLGLNKDGEQAAVMLADIMSTPLRDVLVGLRKYAEIIAGKDGEQDLLIEFQFEGLWAVFQAGKLAAETAK